MDRLRWSAAWIVAVSRLSHHAMQTERVDNIRSDRRKETEWVEAADGAKAALPRLMVHAAAALSSRNNTGRPCQLCRQCVAAANAAVSSRSVLESWPSANAASSAADQARCHMEMELPSNMMAPKPDCGPGSPLASVQMTTASRSQSRQTDTPDEAMMAVANQRRSRSAAAQRSSCTRPRCPRRETASTRKRADRRAGEPGRAKR